MRLSAALPARSWWYAGTRGPKPPSGVPLSMRAASDRPARGRAPIRATPGPRERPQAGDHLQSPQPWRRSGELLRTPLPRRWVNRGPSLALGGGDLCKSGPALFRVLLLRLLPPSPKPPRTGAPRPTNRSGELSAFANFGEFT